MSTHEDDRFQVTFRVTRDERQRIKDYAAAEGVTLQVYLERRALNEPHRQDRRKGPTGNPELRRRMKQQQELPLSNAS